jgi:hypothetical protein
MPHASSPMPDGPAWPRLVYISDTPVADTYAGACLMFRLLSHYPPDRLWVFESSLGASVEADRLPQVRYVPYRGGNSRWLNTRLRPYYSDWLYLTAELRAGPIVGAARGHADAVMTVAHRYAWITAAEVARALDLPLHLIVHDEPSATMGLSSALREAAERKIGQIYCSAASRLCVSPAMVETYLTRYGADGQVLYPARGPGSPEYDAPPDRPESSERSLVFAYGGSLNSDAYGMAMSALAEILEPLGHTLHIYSNLDPARIARYRLDGKHVLVSPMLRGSDYLAKLRETADVLFVPMSFAPEDRTNSEIAFPSKLTEYTAAGLPLIVWGPPGCSAVRWAKLSPGCASVSTQPGVEGLRPAVLQVLSGPAQRRALAEGALAAGHRFFSASSASTLLQSVLLRSP